MAAGGAEVKYRGQIHRLTNPHMVQNPRVTSVPRPVRLILRLLKVDTFLLLDEAPAG